MADTGAARQRAYRDRVRALDPEKYEAMLAKNREWHKATGYKQSPEKKKLYYQHYKHTEKYRITALRRHLKTYYGITIDDYERMFQAQGGVCKICGGKDERKWNNGRKQILPLYVDHCHATGRIRGLLCGKCNTGIAMLKDSISNLQSAIIYLTEAQNF